MKQIFWFVVGAAIVWFVSRRQMDTLYGEISRMRETERKRQETA